MPTRKQLITSGAEVAPLTREEIFLSNAVGGQHEIKPLTPKEIILENISKKGAPEPQ